MNILGIIHGHNSSACLLKDNKVSGCIAEERLDRVKNSTNFPLKSIDYLMNRSGIELSEIDLIVHSSKTVPFIYNKEVNLYENEREGKVNTLFGILKKLIHDMYYYIPISRKGIKWLNRNVSNLWVKGKYIEQIKDSFLRYLNVKRSKIVFADHHTCHAYAGYYGFVPSHLKKLPFVVLTLDGEGDGLCATVSVVKDGVWERISSTESGNSIASFYGAITKFLRMRVNEHEYKVMGLAPYCSDYNRDRTLKKFKGLFKINDDLTFSAKGGGNYISRWLEDELIDDRFDGVAAAAQKYVEDIAVEWVSKVISKTGINNIVLSGGFFMNIKVNKEIMEMPEVNELIVCPSGGDESTVLGAAYFGAEMLGVDIQKDTEKVKNLYLGSNFLKGDIEKSITEYYDDSRYTISQIDNVEDEIAKLLAEGMIVARVTGCSEFGARALGNRSILANPAFPEVVKIINEQIKNRDFWMPFACSILEERVDDYLVNPKNIDMRYMAISCDTKPLAKTHLLGAIHPYDYTARPQIVNSIDSPSYHKILIEFNKLTGIGGLLNTSLNLHGEPLVDSIEDAFSTFNRSGLQYLAIENYIISKVRI